MDGNIPLPTPTFNAPSLGVMGKDYSNLGKSIESLFTAYQQGKQAGLQNQFLRTQIQGAQASQAAGSADFALGHYGLTAQDINQNIDQAMQPSPSYAPPQPQPGQPNSLYGAPTQTPMVQAGQSIPNATAGQPGQPGAVPGPMQSQNAPLLSPLGPNQGQPQPMPGNPGQPMPGQPQDDPKVAVLRQIMAMHLQGAQLGAQTAQANLAKTQAEAGKVGAEAQLTEAQVKMMAGSGAVVDNFVNQIKSGKMKYDDLSNLGRGEFANSIKIAVGNALASQGVNVQALTNEADAGHKGAELSGGGSSQEMARSANSAYKQFDLLQAASDKVARTSNQLLNKPFMKIASTGGVDSQSLMAAIANARIEYARAASGSKSPSDVFMAEAAKALPDSITPAQLPGVISQLKAGLSEMVQGQLTQATAAKPASGYSGGDTHTYPNGVKAQWNGKTWVKVQ